MDEDERPAPKTIVDPGEFEKERVRLLRLLERLRDEPLRERRTA